MDNEPLVIEADSDFQSLCVETANLLTIARGVSKVRDIDTLEKAVDVRENIKEFTESAEKMRKFITAPMLLKKQSVDAAFGALLKALDTKALGLTNDILDWQTRNNPDVREIRTENALVRLRRNAPVPVVTDKMAFLKAIVSKAAGRKDLTVDLVEINGTVLKALIKRQALLGGKKLPPGVKMLDRPDSLV